MTNKQQVIDELSSIQTSLETVLLELWEVTSRAQNMGGEIEVIALDGLRAYVITYLEEMIDAPDLPHSIEAIKVKLARVEDNEQS